MDFFNLLTLLSIPGIGPVRIFRLLERFETPENILKASFAALCGTEGVDRGLAERIRSAQNPEFAKKQMNLAEKKKIRIISFWDPDYPEILREIHDPPVLLFVLGEMDLASLAGIAVVGTRNPTDYGRSVAKSLAKQFSSVRLPVISGMARGIDTMVHQETLRSGGLTVAVLGCGIDVVYPPENRTLYKNILASGCIVSEFPIGTQPDGPNFPRRNRIISGLSRGTLVVEAGQKSGALITAYLALEQGREVFAVPGSIRSMQSVGPNKLLKQGAKLVERAEDVYQEIPQWHHLGLNKKSAPPPLSGLTSPERRVWEHLSDNPVHIDQIAQICETTSAESMALLLTLELKGYVRQMAGMKFIRE